METLISIQNRKSVRRFTDQPVSRAELETLLKAGLAAPSAVDQRAWAFIAIDQPEVLKQLGNELPYAKMLLYAPAAIVVCGDSSKLYDGNPNNLTWVMDCSAATENILLAAVDLNLGTVWTLVYPDEKHIQCVRRILNLPENIIPLNVIPTGHPAGNEPIKDKWNPNLIHWNKW